MRDALFLAGKTDVTRHDMKNRSAQEPVNSSESAEGHLRNVLETLAVALSEANRALQALSKTQSSERKTRVLRSHSSDRKRMVFRFLSWCWNVEGGIGFGGIIPETVAEEFRLYSVWAKRVCPLENRAMAQEIDTLSEYSACREGLRKMLPDKWKVLQTGRNHLVRNASTIPRK